ncbi:MAG: HEAT repeat domain-containing protein [Acidobacteriota bacterium]
MNHPDCNSVREQLAMLLYGELSFDEEERVESHVAGCADCSLALEQQRELSAAIDQAAVEPSPALLRECRQNLTARLAMETVPLRAGEFGVASSPKNLWERILDTFTIQVGMLRPVGAIALLAIGFVGARLAPSVFPALRGSYGAMSLADAGSSRVRSVEPSADGQVRIVLDETRQRTVSGRLDDAEIRGFLLSATKDPSDGLRGQTVALLTSGAGAVDVRDALVYTVRNDQNAGVRLKAMEGLKAFVQETDVRSALADVLSADSNAEMRIRAIDLLMQSMNAAPQKVMDSRTVGVLQELLSRDKENPYMRQRAQDALELVKASSEIF